MDDTVSRYGQYTIIWHKDGAGNWRYLPDIGNSHPAQPMATTCEQVGPFVFSNGLQRKITDLPKIDSLFSAVLNINRRLCYATYASGVSYLLNLNGHTTIGYKENTAANIGNATLKFTRKGMLTSSSGDLAAFFGQVSNREKQGNYLRIWRLEKHGWRVALEVFA